MLTMEHILESLREIHTTLGIIADQVEEERTRDAIEQIRIAVGDISLELRGCELVPPRVQRALEESAKTLAELREKHASNPERQDCDLQVAKATRGEP